MDTWYVYVNEKIKKNWHFVIGLSDVLVNARSLWPRPLSGTDYRVTFVISAAPPIQEETENIPVLCCLSLTIYFILFYFSIVLYLRLRSSCIWRTIQMTVLLLLLLLLFIGRWTMLLDQASKKIIIGLNGRNQASRTQSGAISLHYDNKMQPLTINAVMHD